MPEKERAASETKSEVGAVIIAAGLSSRMKDFKSLLKLGDLTVIETVVTTMLHAGIRQIVVVAGYQADRLKARLKEYSDYVTIAYNPDYATSGMFESAIIGIRHLQGRCGKIIFTPADIPAFHPTTVKKLLDQDCDLACPVYHGKKGHPVLIAGKLIDFVVHDSGEGGLKGAFGRSETAMRQVPVKDEGVLYDMDSPEDYRKMASFMSRRGRFQCH